MKRIFKNIAVLAIALGSTYSCENYLDVNTDPNNITQETGTPPLQLSAAITEPHIVMSQTANRLGNIMMQTWAGDVTNYTGAFQDEFALSFTTSMYTGIWRYLYLDTATLTAMANNEDEQYAYYSAVAKVMRAYYFQYIVDLYGDVPYSEAHQLGDNLTPAYDDDAAIYVDLIAQVTAAIETFENAPASALDIEASSDPVYGGDINSWLEFANTMKLRLLVRQESTGNSNSEFASIDGASFISSDVTVNPGYADVASQLNPLYDLFYDAGGAIDGYTLYVGANYAVEFLKGASTEDGIATGISDPRIAALYTLEDGTYTGVVQGDNDVPSGNTLSNIGPGRVISPSQDGYLMTAAESYFLQAEAAYKGYISGDAQALFQAGITASFLQLGLTNASATSYIAASNGVNKIGWDGTTDKMEAIMTQKWIALNGLHGLESWIEYTRTGYPDVPLSTIAQQPARPNRMLYPNSEYSGNSANVPSQSASDIFNTFIFWDN
ncbi:SusD/RagB family nutrient-binding outer membrane lipoprotein [Neptunitalea lumnitzerae]|uniref:Starch-binding associating with outer membrane n=1 Tax=Neptunitalea lumnitzerae TaxID=2965509 RepID=A0ABQ5MHE4_9FLAO|nr:SusD/RagB family nutrient-binding outer membrane lipoprotein [Neptunitalea sp. Y10]GLB48824.1 hypothetical protein Y10_11920 [Neptunitalea sp. Y10]